MQKIKKYWWVIGIVFALGGWATFVELGLAASAKKDATQDKIIEKQAEVDLRLIGLLEKMNGKLDVVMAMLGFKVADSTISRWKSMPQAPVFDSLGNRVIGAEWLDISKDYLLGHRMKWAKFGKIMVRVEWDERKK